MSLYKNFRILHEDNDIVWACVDKREFFITRTVEIIGRAELGTRFFSIKNGKLMPYILSDMYRVIKYQQKMFPTQTILEL